MTGVVAHQDRRALSPAGGALSGEAKLLGFERPYMDLATAYHRFREWKSDELAYTCGDPAPALPTSADARALYEALSKALAQQPDSRTTLVLLGLMVDAFPSARIPQPQTYLEALTADVIDGGYSPAAVAMACREIRRTKTFVPSIAEVLQACEEARKQLVSRRSIAARMVDACTTAESPEAR